MTPDPWTLNPDKIDIDNCEVKVEGAPENDWLFPIHHIFTDQRIGWAVI